MRITTILIAGAFLAGCATPEPTFQEGPDREVSFDGLVRVDNARFLGVWADPEIDFSRYTKVLPGSAEFQFRAVRKSAGQTTVRRSTDREFWIDDADRERLKQEAEAIFAEELANSTRFEITDERGSDVLILRGALHDIVSNTPPQLISRGEIYLTSAGEATLIIEAVDSMSGEVIARIIERRAAQRPGGQAFMSNTVTTWSEVRRLLRNWAGTLREGLDALPTA